MKAFAVALLGLAVSAPAMAGPYVESKHEFKGTDDDYSKAVHQARVGYETKVGALSPYIEGGVGVTYPEGGEETTFTALKSALRSKSLTSSVLMVSGKTFSKVKMIPVIGKLKSAQSTSSEELKNETFTSPCGRFNCCYQYSHSCTSWWGGDKKADAPAVFKLNGAGATFPAPLYNSWFQSFNKDTGNQVNYQAVGSGAGVRQFTAKTVDFGASDGAVSDAKQKLPMIHVPMTGGAIVPAYNYPGCDAKMTQTQLADVFLGKITNWSTFGCADKQIVTVHRSDGSGTTKGFTNSLSAFSPEWKKTVGTGKAVQWPVGVGGKGNSGVAGVIKNNSRCYRLSELWLCERW